MLSYTKDTDYFRMTVEALTSLRSEGFDWHMILVETNPAAASWYEGLDVEVIVPNEPFNYNRFLNHGFHRLRSDGDTVVICNNDLIADPGWFAPIWQTLDEGILEAASPKAPEWPCHESYPDPGIIAGYRVSYEFCGWCWAIKRPALDRLLPLDEIFFFESQDQDVVEKMRGLGIRHGIVLHSHVRHLLNQSHALIPEERRHEMFEGCHQKFKEKYGA
jgi:glycosyltransferase involved in cell wall biosynthesis